jgi:hypothetical protein
MAQGSKKGTTGSGEQPPSALHDDKDLPSRLHRWLEGQGFPLEMRVARAFRSAGFEVSVSENYLDPATQKPREIDVLARMSSRLDGADYDIIYAVECKSGKSHPWVCLSDSSSTRRDLAVGFAAREASHYGRELLTELAANPYRAARDLFELPPTVAYNVTEGLRGEQRENNLDVAYTSLLSSRQAARGLISHCSDRNDSERIEVVAVVLPLVVIAARLFNLTLTDGNLKLDEIAHQTILRTGFDRAYAASEIVTQPAVDDFAKQRAHTISEFLRKLETSRLGIREEIARINEIGELLPD